MSPTRIITVAWFMAIIPALEARWVGRGGMFGGNGDAATDHPSSFAGDAHAWGQNDGTHNAESFAGAFGAHRQQACLEGVCEFVLYTTKSR